MDKKNNSKLDSGRGGKDEEEMRKRGKEEKRKRGKEDRREKWKRR